jgi:hypothetical protein
VALGSVSHCGANLTSARAAASRRTFREVSVAPPASSPGAVSQSLGSSTARPERRSAQDDSVKRVTKLRPLERGGASAERWPTLPSECKLRAAMELTSRRVRLCVGTRNRASNTNRGSLGFSAGRKRRLPRPAVPSRRRRDERVNGSSRRDCSPLSLARSGRSGTACICSPDTGPPILPGRHYALDMTALHALFAFRLLLPRRRHA